MKRYLAIRWATRAEVKRINEEREAERTAEKRREEALKRLAFLSRPLSAQFAWLLGQLEKYEFDDGLPDWIWDELRSFRDRLAKRDRDR